MCEEYNGWANRETWAVALHINNDQGWQEAVYDALSAGPYGSEGFTLAEAREAFYNAPTSIYSYAGDIIRDNVESTFDPEEYGDPARWVERIYPITQDIGSLYRVDWREIGANFLTALTEDEA